MVVNENDLMNLGFDGETAGAPGTYDIATGTNPSPVTRAPCMYLIVEPEGEAEGMFFQSEGYQCQTERYTKTGEGLSTPFPTVPATRLPPRPSTS